VEQITVIVFKVMFVPHKTCKRSQ